MMIPIWLLPLLFVAVVIFGALLEHVWCPKASMTVEVGPSHDEGGRVHNAVSARIRNSDGDILVYKRVDMTQDGCEEALAEAVAEMKQKARSLETATRIAQETRR